MTTFSRTVAEAGAIVHMVVSTSIVPRRGYRYVKVKATRRCFVTEVQRGGDFETLLHDANAGDLSSRAHQFRPRVSCRCSARGDRKVACLGAKLEMLKVYFPMTEKENKPMKNYVYTYHVCEHTKAA